MAERLKFNIELFSFSAGAGSGASFPGISLTIANNSAYSFWQPLFYIELLNSGSRVGIVSGTLPQFRALQSRTIDFRLFGDTTVVTDAVLHPIVDVFDPNVFMAPR